jgi:hypothetical protein
MSTIDASRRRPGRSAQAQLIDLHFEVRNAIADVLAAPTSASQLALKRALDRFLAAERTFASIGESAIEQAGLAARRADLLHCLQLLDAAEDRDRAFAAAASLRSTFLSMCHPLWHWRQPHGDDASED